MINGDRSSGVQEFRSSEVQKAKGKRQKAVVKNFPFPFLTGVCF
jgi:hypothetical protein